MSTATFLKTMSSISERPLYTFNGVWSYLNQTMVNIPPTKKAATAPQGTVYVPQNKSWTFAVNGVEIEGDDAHGVDVQYSWEEHPQREHYSAYRSVHFI